MKLFNFGQKELRVIEKDGEPYFILNEICSVLDLAPRVVRQRLSDDVCSTYPIPDALGRMQDNTIVNEDGLYDTILESRKPEARSFRKWITSDVIPSIRKTGSYSIQQFQLPQTWAETLRMLADEMEDKQRIQTENLMLEQRVKEYEPKISYLDSILKSTDTVTVTQIAKDYGLTGQALNKILHEEKVQYNVGGQWLLYQKHQDKGFTKSQTIDVHHTDGHKTVKMNTKWTQKGRLFIHETLSNRGIVPYMDREQTSKEA